MRLIDADVLPITALINGGHWTKDVVYKADIDAAHTVDAVEVTRCENCERSKLDGFYCCGADMMPPHKTFPHCFCSFGERKEG